MSLRDWQRNSWLVEHKSSREEITALLAIVERDLANAKVAGLADDWRLSIAYNAALQAATAALAASSFRAAREQHHFRTIQSLAFTIGWPDAKVDCFDRFRKKRNIGSSRTRVRPNYLPSKISITLRLESIRRMQIGNIGWGHMRGARTHRVAMMRKGFGGHTVAAKDSQP